MVSIMAIEHLLYPEIDLLSDLKQKLETIGPRATKAMQLAEELAVQKLALEDAIARLEGGVDASSAVIQGSNPSARRKKEEMDRIKSATLSQLSMYPQSSADVFFQLVQQGIVLDQRKDRDYVMRHLRNLAEHNKINRKGDAFWLEAPDPVDPAYDMNEEPF